MVFILLLIRMSGHFYLMIDITNFTLLDADFGGQSLNIVEFILICY